MKDGRLWQLDAVDMGRRFRSGELTPLAMAHACLARLDEFNPRINAVVARRDEQFLAEAQASTQRHARGQPLSALDGVPLTVKDSLFACELPTTWGSPALRDFRSPDEELAVVRARAGGALVLGKTNVPEFALEGYTDNALFGATRNPWDLALTPGGSSGGAVAAVAAGIAPLALGQDGGGSIRRPASHTGLVGLKPSLGTVPRHRALPSLLLDFEVIGPIARSVAGARLLFDAIRGPQPVDRCPLVAPPVPAAAHRVVPRRVLYVERLGDAPLDPQVAASVAAAAARLEALGHGVESGPLPLDIDFLEQAWPCIGEAGLARAFDEHPEWERAASDKYREMARRGRGVSAEVMAGLVRRVAQLRREAAGLFERHDMVLMPAAAALPWPAQLPYPEVIAGRAAGPRGHAVYTGWVNAAGLPALALPCHPSSEGLPIGLQLIGAHGADDDLLDLGEAYEAAWPWADRWPDP